MSIPIFNDKNKDDFDKIFGRKKVKNEKIKNIHW